MSQLQTAANAAQRILAHVGVATESTQRLAHGSKNASATKRAPGRYPVSGEPGARLSKSRTTRAYVALGAAWAAKRVTNAKRRDEHGAYTLTGGTYSYEGVAPTSRDHVISGGKDDGEPFFTGRRIWLAGISSQRGY